MSKEYVINTLADFAKVPVEKLPECLRDFSHWLNMYRASKSYEQSLVQNGMMPTYEIGGYFIWKDDGVAGVQQVEITSDGQKLGRIDVTK